MSLRSSPPGADRSSSATPPATFPATASVPQRQQPPQPLQTNRCTPAETMTSYATSSLYSAIAANGLGLTHDDKCMGFHPGDCQQDRVLGPASHFIHSFHLQQSHAPPHTPHGRR